MTEQALKDLEESGMVGSKHFYLIFQYHCVITPFWCFRGQRDVRWHHGYRCDPEARKETKYGVRSSDRAFSFLRQTVDLSAWRKSKAMKILTVWGAGGPSLPAVITMFEGTWQGSKNSSKFAYFTLQSPHRRSLEVRERDSSCCLFDCLRVVKVPIANHIF